MNLYDIKVEIKFRWYGLFGIPIYHTVSSKKNGYTWFEVAKNGSRTIHSILNEHAPADYKKRDHPYLKSKHQSNFKFAIIRNPWDRFVSCYTDKVLKKKLYPSCWDKDIDFFIDFVSKHDLRYCNEHFRLQTSLFPKDDLDFVGRMENYDEDIKHIMNQLNIESDIPHRNKSTRTHYSEYYNPERIKRVADLYAEDIEFGGYQFEVNQ